MVDLTVVPMSRPRADARLVSALEQLVDVAKQGKIDRMICLCTGDREFAQCLKYRANSLALIGVLSVTLSKLQNEWDIST